MDVKPRQKKIHCHNNKSILKSIFKAIKSLQKPNDKYITIMYIYVATFTPRNPEPREAPVWEVALGWSQGVSQGFWSSPHKVTGTNLPSSKRPPHLRKRELCFQLSCCACGQHAREWGLNFASFCKELNNKKRVVSPFKVINRMKVLLQPVVVLLWEAALALGAQSEQFCKGIFTALWKTPIFLLNVNGSLTWSQLELQSSAYNNDLCIKCGWSVIFIILMRFWCSVSQRTAAKWHWNQLWTRACVHALANTTHVWCSSQGSE